MLKGKTRIELKDVHTGAVEVIEEENMVTNALQYFFNPMGLVKAGDLLFTSEYVDYYMTLTGGLLLLAEQLDEDADNVILPEGVRQTGCAVYDKQNASNQTLRGNFNATESEFSLADKMAKYVYDFDTSEGNGTIACVALTHAYGGYGTQGTKEAPVRGAYPFFKSVGSGLLRYCGSNSGIGGYDRTLTNSNYGSGYNWIFRIDATKDCVFYFSVLSTTSIAIRRYRANLKTISFFERPGAARTLLEQKDVALSQAINQRYFSYSYDDEANKLYLVSASSYAVSNNGAFLITEIDLGNDYAVKQYSVTNTTGETIKIGYDRCNTLCYRGFLYFTSYNATSGVYGVYRLEIGNSANLQKMAVGFSRDADPLLAREGKILFEGSLSSSTNPGCFVVDVEDFSYQLPETYTMYDSYRRQYIPVDGYPLMYYVGCGASNGTFAIRTDYLATINNLDSPVVKTADKTMKVTYTITEDS